MQKRKPTTKEEDALRAQGYELIAGVDEAGKGAWAGPIVAAAVILPKHFDPKDCMDSKLLTPKQREKMFVHIVHHAVSWAVGVVGHDVIDTKGIQAANKAVIEQALKKLPTKPDTVLIDAVKIVFGKVPVKAIIDGDAKVLSIAAASIVAKVARDALMSGEHWLYPHYEFKVHKGYGTPKHQALLQRHGLSPIHRTSFRPMNGKAKTSATARVANARKK